jgi:molybdopterin synthase sulfur carrier subunit
VHWKLFADLAEAAGEREPAVAGDPDTVEAALESLLSAYPDLRERVTDADGDLRPDVNVLRNGEPVAGADGLATPVEDGDELALLPPVRGG